MAAGWKVVVFYPAVDYFLNTYVAAELALMFGPAVTADAKALVPRRRGANLFRSLHWDLYRDEHGPFVQIGGHIYDMDIEAPADQFKREHPKALKTALATAIGELSPIML